MILVLLLLVLGANGAPIIAEKWLGRRFNAPIDGGICIGDGRPVFGRAKTIRGVLAAVLVCSVITGFVGQPIWLGVKFGIYAMLGDLLSSFLKRRLAIPASGKAIGLDQVPESFLPLWMLREEFGISLEEILLLVSVFFIVEIVLSKWLYRWHIRKRPY